MGETTIRAAADVDSGWLTDVLHSGGVGIGRNVNAFEATSIGTGQVGENVRFELTWDVPSGELPASVVGKFPSLSPVSRASSVQVGTYHREVGFYRDLHGHVDISAPDIHHVGWDPATHDFVLVMSDVRNAAQGDQLAGCTPDEARVVVTEVAGLHVPTWGSAGRWPFEWLQQPDDERVGLLAMLYQGTLPGFGDRYRDVLGADVVAIAERVVAGFPTLAEHSAAWAASTGGWCVVHADYRLDNLLFGEAGDVTVVDWQTVSYGIGPADVAYFLGSGLVPVERERHELALVADYAATVRARGVEIADDLVWDGYVLGAAGGLLMAILASQIVERTDRGDAMFVAMAERHAAQIEHVGLLDRL